MYCKPSTPGYEGYVRIDKKHDIAMHLVSKLDLMKISDMIHSGYIRILSQDT